jgi:hypothetical protein
MRTLSLGIAVLASASTCAAAADFEIYRCTTPKGEVTYQPVPCPLSATERRIEILPFSAGYDPSDGGTIFKREAEMDKRRAENAAKEAESAQAEGTVPSTLDRVGKAHAPILPTETSNEARRENTQATTPSRRR